MSHNLLNKKRNILQNLNVHLQIQAIKLGHVDRDTNILPNSIDNKTGIKSSCSNKNQVVKPSVHGSVESKTNNKPKQKLRKLRPYDPLYTWNRGGRLKELRIRCYARKYFHIWRNKCLGRVTDAEATRFYRVKLLKKYWIIWYEQHWQLRIEPRLLGRAILYRKSIVMRSTFLAWQWWTKLRAFGRVKMEIAIKYNANNMKKHVVNVWLSWIFVRKCKTKLSLLGENWTRNNLLSHYLALWTRQLLVKRDTESNMIIAIHHNTVSVLSKVWQQWTEVRPDLRWERLGNMKAYSYYRNILLKKSLIQWIQYQRKYRSKKKELDKWRDHYNWNIAHRFLKIWREQYVRSLTISVVDIRITDLARRFQLRRIVVVWRYYMKEVEEKKRGVLRASQCHELALKRRMWVNMMRFCAMEREKADMRIRGREFNDKITLRMYFSKWSDMLEHKDDLTRMVELGASRAHYRRTLFLKCFRHFSNFVDQSNAAKERKKRADNFRRMKVLQRSVSGWLHHITVVIEKKKILQTKNEFLKDHVLRHLWHLWISRTTQQVTAKKNLAEFLDQKVVKDKKRLLLAWHALTNEQTTTKNEMERARQHYQETLLIKCMRAMTTFVQEKEESRCRNELARSHFTHRIVSDCFNALRNYTESKARKRTIVSGHIAAKEWRVKRSIFDTWKALVEEHKLTNIKVDSLCAQKMRATLQTRFVQWRRIVRIRKNKRCDSTRLVTAAKKELETNLALRTLRHWKDRTLSRCNQSNKFVVANEFNRLQVLTKYFDVWRRYHDEQQMNAHKREQASWLRRKSLLTRTWMTWTRAHVDKLREEYYTKFALAHWAHKLEDQVLHGWMRYMIERRQKREEEKEAFALFQARVRRYTIGQWLRSGDFLYQWRQSQHRSGCNDSSLIARVFDHWRHWTTRRVAAQRHTVTDTRPPATINILRPSVKSSTTIIQKTHRSNKQRPAPKIPDFLLTSVERIRLSEKITVDRSGTGEDCPDDELMSPASFAGAERPRTHQSYMDELHEIKERLKSFKDRKDCLRRMRSEVHEYDRVLNQLSLSHANSSFCREFSPEEHRQELLSHVAEMERSLGEELPICTDLMKRAQTLVTLCRHP